MFFFRRKPDFTDGVIDLLLLDEYTPRDGLGFGRVYDFAITPHGKLKDAGAISFRVGESEGVYYFGHIGYHVNQGFRGQGWAGRACRLLVPLMQRCGKNSVVITTDTDNIPSRKTCERLGCTLERVVDVPQKLRDHYDISAVKCRYIWRIGTAD